MTSNDGAVRSVIGGVYAAWGDNDADSFVASYAEDATATLPGSRLVSKRTIHATMTEAFAGPLKGSRCIDEIQHIRFIGDDAAVVFGRSGIVQAGQTEPAGWELTTWALSRQDGRWLVEAYHDCPEK
jgi:uncharacterized protein (TIGR02246 family)